MTKRMLIDATHAEETRVVVLDDNRLEDFDVETATKKQLKGNIYLAKIVRVEPSLQAAFVEYGGGRHGFLAFGEIHPDYYQIPVADRQRLLAIQAEEARAAEAEEDAAAAGETIPPARRAQPDASEPPPAPEPAAGEPDRQAPPPPLPDPEEDGDAAADMPDSLSPTAPDAEQPDALAPASEAGLSESDLPASDVPDSDAPEGDVSESDLRGDDPEQPDRPWTPAQPALMARDERFGPVGTAPEPDPPGDDLAAAEPVVASVEEPPDIAFSGAGAAEVSAFDIPDAGDQPPPETVGGDDGSTDGAEDARVRRASRLLRTYRIQEVIHRRQIVLVQVVKEERGTKGAALTTYISLAGRFSVLMPNSPRGGGVSRKITSAADRKRLKEVMTELDLPQGMGLIVRTAGANRPKPEIKRDCEYLMRLWDDIREHTLRSVAPSLIYEEASLIKRAIRDVYSRDIDEITVDGEEGWRAAHEFMRMLMPSHARKVQLWRGPEQGGGQPLFAKYQVEAQLEAMLSPTVQLKSGGYLVVNQTEALVAIDVNSGRSTRERNIEETALRTNLEAADEVGRQLRLRDLAGLIVIDFIDMESRKHNAAVEKRLKDALKVDRARIQVGHISHFGLLEMSRQRLRPSLAETSFDPCPHCGGTGHVRNIDSSAISVLRAIEDEGAKAKASVIMVHATGSVVMYLLNHKRDRLAEIEGRFGMRVQFASDDSLTPGQVRIDRVRPMGDAPPPRPVSSIPVIPAAPAVAASEEDEADLSEDDEGEDEDSAAEGGGSEAAQGSAGEDGDRRRRRRRRRRGGRRENGQADPETGGAEPPRAGTAEAGAEPRRDDAPEVVPERQATAPEADATAEPGDEQPSLDAADLDENGMPRARRRGRRGGRRRRGGEEQPAQPVAAAQDDAEPDYAPAAYTGPTPADPFGGGAFDIFDMIDMAGEEPAPAAAPETTSRPVAAEPEAIVPAEVEAPDETAVAGSERASMPEPAAPPEPTAPPEAVAPASEQAAPTPVAEPQGGPKIQPVLIGEGEPAAERKRGWWRR